MLYCDLQKVRDLDFVRERVTKTTKKVEDIVDVKVLYFSHALLCCVQGYLTALSRTALMV